VRAPRPRNTPIDARRLRSWVDRFASYREQVTVQIVESWIEQFLQKDQDVAARILDSVQYYSQAQIEAAFRDSLTGLHGWSADPGEREGRWAFAAMSSGAGESGDAMMHAFRVANRLDKRQFSDLFLHRADLFRQANLPESDPGRLGPDDTVVLLDDFSGTGKQVCDAWNGAETSFGALLANVGQVYLILVAVGAKARAKIADETELTLKSAHLLHDSDDVFAANCPHFNNSDREALLKYGKKADKKNPRGFGECGLTVVFQHRAPNNSIPILHADHGDWTGLFPRHA
jgi:hypothetical protein